MGKLSKQLKEVGRALSRGKIGRAYQKGWQRGPLGHILNPGVPWIEKARRRLEETRIGKAWRAYYRSIGMQRNTGLGTTGFTGSVNSSRTTIGNTGFHRYT